jgi:hypothetical protein
MDIETARKLSLELRRERRSVIRVRADVEGDRIVFSGGREGSHSLAIDVSSPERVLAHWEGYCENNGLPRPTVGQKVLFVGATGKTYVGRIVKVGTKRVHLEFKYRHGGNGKATVRLGEIRFQ